MRLFGRNALGVYAVYAASLVSGLLVTPIVFHHLGVKGFGIWGTIGAWTIYLSVLDFGVGPAIIRSSAEARGRGAPEDVNAIASVGLAMYAVIGLLTLPVGIGLAFLVPWAGNAPADLVWPARICTLLVVLSIAARFPLGLFTNLLIGRQRWDVQNLANFVSTVLYAGLVAVFMTHGGGLVVLGVLTLATTLVRLALPLAWIPRELPGLRVSRSLVTRERLRELVSFSSSNFMVHVANKIVFSTDVVVVSIVLGIAAAGVYAIPAKLFALAFGLGTAATTLLYPAFAELEGAGVQERQRRLLLLGLRVGSALMLLLALPLLLIPDVLINAWIGGHHHEAYAVMSLLAGVLLIHQPIFVLTQFLIARARQRDAAALSLGATAANLALSVVLAWAVGMWGVALSTLVTDAVALCWLLPRMAAPAAGTTTGELVRVSLRPVLPALVAAAVVLVAGARLWTPRTMPELVPLGATWAIVGSLAIWRFGLSQDERRRLGRVLGRRPRPVPI